MVRVRRMTEADADAVAAVRVAGWRTAYRGLMPQAYLDAMDPAVGAARHRTVLMSGTDPVVDLVAEAADGVVGWACSGPCRDADLPAATDELYALYVRPDLIGTGVGRALYAAALQGARERGAVRQALWVLRDNARARRFYERAGLAADGAERVEPVGGAPVTEVRYVRVCAV
ncbi:GNAT family N-acetyltransferase [Streptomyces luteireticuli]|uniref:GNAT family N-acetyltransferase n=1 Tax=Streptomyces luteireticuli TaxID=173858 RepID=A0ABP3IPU2_9ACTN